MTANPRRRKARRSRSRRRHSRNPGVVTLRRPLGAVTAGFNPSALTNAGTIALGVFGNAWLRNQVTGRVPQLSGNLSYVAGIGSAGLMLLVPKVGKQLFVGGLMGEVARAMQQFLFPTVRLLGLNLSEYLTDDEAGMGESLTDEDLASFEDAEAGLQID